MPDVLIVVALMLALTWLASMSLGLRSPAGLPRNALIWIAIGAAILSFVLTWRELNRKAREDSLQKRAPGRHDDSV